jgi:hypothetical protein
MPGSTDDWVHCLPGLPEQFSGQAPDSFKGCHCGSGVCSYIPLGSTCTCMANCDEGGTGECWPTLPEFVRTTDELERGIWDKGFYRTTFQKENPIVRSSCPAKYLKENLRICSYHMYSVSELRGGGTFTSAMPNRTMATTGNFKKAIEDRPLCFSSRTDKDYLGLANTAFSKSCMCKDGVCDVMMPLIRCFCLVELPAECPHYGAKVTTGGFHHLTQDMAEAGTELEGYRRCLYRTNNAFFKGEVWNPAEVLEEPDMATGKEGGPRNVSHSHKEFYLLVLLVPAYASALAPCYLMVRLIESVRLDRKYPSYDINAVGS